MTADPAPEASADDSETMRAVIVRETGDADVLRVERIERPRPGAKDVLLTARDEDFSARLHALTGGRGADVVIDNVGTPLFAATRRSLAVNGRWVLVGQISGGFVPFTPAQLLLRTRRCCRCTAADGRRRGSRGASS